MNCRNTPRRVKNRWRSARPARPPGRRTRLAVRPDPGPRL